MSPNPLPIHSRLTANNELPCSPLDSTVQAYRDALRAQQYSEHTIDRYLGVLKHFDHWMDFNGLGPRDIDVTLVDAFVQGHLSTCNCNLKLHGSVGESKAALRHLLKLLPSTLIELSCPTNTITAELDLFADYLRNIRGVKPGTVAYFCRDVRALLSYCFKDRQIEPHHLRTIQIDAFLRSAGLHMRTSSVQVVCTSLRSYFRFRSLKGDATETLSASLPRFSRRNQRLPKTLSETQLVAFLKAFDLSNPVELRDYAIARCLLDLGLRGDEVTHLTLQSVDWRSATLILSNTKSKRAQRMPLPAATGEVIARYLHDARPQTADRRLFVRHRAPVGKPLDPAAIRSAMNRAFERCGLRDQFCNTHVLRRTMATRLQRAGISVKEIADLLRHGDLDTAKTYARVDVESLRKVALPWPGSLS